MRAVPWRSRPMESLATYTVLGSLVAVMARRACVELVLQGLRVAGIA